MGQKISDQEIKDRIIILLRKFTDVCEKNDLKYYMAYGSALGTVRHHGFIPWDDDIDVSMPREDYNKFIDICRKNDCGFDVLCHKHTKGYLHYFAKIVDRDTTIQSKYMKEIDGLGVFIDVFPMDELELSEKEQVKVEKKMEKTIKTLKLSGMKCFWPSDNKVKSFFKHCMYYAAKKKGTSYWLGKYEAVIASAKKKKDGNSVQYLVGWTIFEKKVFGNGVMLPFGDMKLCCPEKYDIYLKKLYGDYMKVPPVEKQVSVHDFTVYRKDNQK